MAELIQLPFNSECFVAVQHAYQVTWITRKLRRKRFAVLCDRHLERLRRGRRVRLNGISFPAFYCQWCRSEQESLSCAAE